MKHLLKTIKINLFCIVFAFVFTIFLQSSVSKAASIADYTNYPVFITQSTTPNVLIILDNSGSMQSDAYPEDHDNDSLPDYDKNKIYYGYFDNDIWYKYSSSWFIEDTNETGIPRFKGNLLNWACMRRVDVARKVLMGGRSESAGTKKRLVGYSGGSGLMKFHENGDVDPSTDLVGPADQYNYDYKFKLSSGYIRFYYWRKAWGGGKYSVENWYRIKVEVPPEKITGVIQKTSDKVRYGLEFFNYSEGGKIVDRIKNKNGPNLLNSIQYRSANTYTPLAEAFYEACRYFQQIRPKYGGSFSVNPTWDPYYDEDSKEYVPCAKSFVILITDGQSTKDKNIPSWLRNYDKDTNDALDPVKYPYDGSDYLDDIALWAHTTDLRSDLAGTQNITLYTIFAFGKKLQLLKDAAINGGFIDSNGDNKPDKSEWDSNDDGEPDTYFSAEDGFKLESSLINAISDILKRATSGTAVSVLATSSRGEGSVYQAHFLPSKSEGIEEVKWLGYLQSLWVDSFGNMREDSDGDKHLVYSKDNIIQFEFDKASNSTIATRYSDEDGDGVLDEIQAKGYPVRIPMKDVKPIWEAGINLANREPMSRKIFTFLDVDKSMTPISKEKTYDGSDDVISFSTAYDERLRPYLGAASETEASNIISYIRGEEIQGYRSRAITVGAHKKVWKLGDIVHSTPTPVGRPQSNYDLMYGDDSYLKFMQVPAIRDRETVIYVGANDGMLHAISGGRFYRADDVSTASVDHGWFEKAGSTPLGSELWAFIPHAALPHLKWLTSKGYTHVSYVDLKPKIADMRIFPKTGDSKHPHGWGTVLIGGMRFGGGSFPVTDGDFVDGSRTFRSEYFMLDITDPRKPEVLMRFETPNLGFSLSYPAVAKVGDTWYVIIGSGPDNKYDINNRPNYDGVSTQKARLYIINMNNKTWHERILEEENAFLGSPITVDVDFSPSQSPAKTYNTEVGYIGEAYKKANVWHGGLYRFITKGNVDPSEWSVNKLMIKNLDNPVLTAPAITTDGNENLWIYFGTGKMLSKNDKKDTDTEYFIGVKEPCTDFSSSSKCTTSNSSVDLKDLSDVTNVVVSNGGTKVSGARRDIIGNGTWKGLLSSTVEDPTYEGWIVQFPPVLLNSPTEKVMSKATVIGGLVLFTTYLPDNSACSFGGTGYLYSLYYETGTANKESTIGLDVNNINVLKRITLGQGSPSSVSMHIGRNEEGKSFIQTSTGTIVEVDTKMPFSVKSGIFFWAD